MYTTPITLIVGPAGSGKDTIAGFMAKNHGALMIAQADPMKRLAKILFDFSAEQLWGPSDCRNAVDQRFNYQEDAGFSRNCWDAALTRLGSQEVHAWLHDLGLGVNSFTALRLWYNNVMAQTYWAKKGLTPRLVLQTLGTEWGRKQGRELWSQYAIRKALTLLGGGFRYDREVGLIEDSGFTGPDRVVITDGRFRNEVINVLATGGTVVRIDSPSINTEAIEAAGVKGHASEKEQKSLPNHFFTHFIMNDKRLGLAAAERNTTIMVNSMERLGPGVGYGLV